MSNNMTINSGPLFQHSLVSSPGTGAINPDAASASSSNDASRASGLYSSEADQDQRVDQLSKAISNSTLNPSWDWSNLYVDALVSILKFVTPTELAKINLVSRHYRQAVKHGHLLRVFLERDSTSKIQSWRPIKDKVKRLIDVACQAGPSLRSLSLAFSEHLMHEHIIKLRTACPNLQTLNLSNCPQLTQAAFEVVATFPYLTTLDVSYCPGITDSTIQNILSQAKQLTTLIMGQAMRPLNFFTPIITDAAFSNLTVDSKLEILSISDCEGLTNACCEYLSRLTRLTALNFKYCQRISHLGLAKLPTTIRELVLQGTTCYDDVFEVLPKFTCLVVLNLGQCFKNKGAIDHFNHLKKLVNLTTFNFLIYDSKDISMLPLLAGAHGLRILDLRGRIQLIDEDLIYAQNWTKLEKVCIHILRDTKTPFSGRGLANFAKAPNLKFLDLELSDFSPTEGMKAISQIKALTNLHLSLENTNRDKEIVRLQLDDFVPLTTLPHLQTFQLIVRGGFKRSLGAINLWNEVSALFLETNKCKLQGKLNLH